MPHTLNHINQMTQPEFVATLGPAFEQTPEIAARTWNHRPFNSLGELHHHMVKTLHTMTREEQLTLIHAHPNLGSRATMAKASVAEQKQAGLTHLSPQAYHQLQQLNQQYQEIFGFPFILAVTGHSYRSVMANINHRLTNSAQVEFHQALREIEIIAQLRLQQWICQP